MRGKMANKLTINLEAMEAAETKLRSAVDDLTDIQKALQSAMEEMLKETGWSGDGSSGFNRQYETSWVEGIEDRKAVMLRMCDHLSDARASYRPIVEEAERLKLTM